MSQIGFMMILSGCQTPPELAISVVTQAPPPSVTSSVAVVQMTAVFTPTLPPVATPSVIPSRTLLALEEDADRGREMGLPTNTPLPPTVTLTPSPTAIPTKPWLLKLSHPGGDGGTSHDIFFGRLMPDVILFEDGQLLVRDEENISEKWFENQWYWETYLSQDEVLDLISQIEAEGFFEKVQNRNLSEIDWLYNFDETTEFSDGVDGTLLCVNFNDTQNCLSLYGPYLPYLVPEIANTLALIQDFHPTDKAYTSFKPESMVLRVELMTNHIITDAFPQIWPANLPALSQLLERYPTGVIPLEGDDAMAVFSLFNFQIDDGIFVEDGVEYYVIGRPFLPNEAIDSFWHS